MKKLLIVPLAMSVLFQGCNSNNSKKGEETKEILLPFISNKKEEQLNKMPLIESRFSKSKDGRFIIHKTIITTIRPTAYFEKVMESEGTVGAEDVQIDLGDNLV